LGFGAIRRSATFRPWVAFLIRLTGANPSARSWHSAHRAEWIGTSFTPIPNQLRNARLETQPGFLLPIEAQDCADTVTNNRQKLYIGLTVLGSR